MKDELEKRLLSVAHAAVDQACAQGADTAEAVVRWGKNLSAQVRLGAPESLEQGEESGLGLRVFIGERSGKVSTNDLTHHGLARAVADALDLAHLSEPDPFALPPDPALLAKGGATKLKLYDPSVETVSGERALELSDAAERAALVVDARLAHSEGASFGWGVGASAFVFSSGFSAFSRGSMVSTVARPIVDDEGGKKRQGYAWDASRTLERLAKPEDIGREAARRTLAKLGARRVPTQEVAVVFDREAARSILGLVAGCVLGSSIWRSSSYLKDREGSVVGSPLLTVIDDPLIEGAFGSREFDGEGLPARRSVVIERGVLKTYLLDSYSARKLGKESTASASRGGAGGVSVTTSNFIMQGGGVSHDELVRSTPKGLYVTEMMGYGFNAVTGDLSRGAGGFWIENGALTHPVSEVTISLNLDQLLQRIDAVANDQDWRSSMVTPTFRVSGMMVAGS